MGEGPGATGVPRDAWFPRSGRADPRAHPWAEPGGPSEAPPDERRGAGSGWPGGPIEPEPSGGRRRRRTVLILAAVVAVVSAVGVVAWRVLPGTTPLGYGTYWVPSNSMAPTLEFDEFVRIRRIDGHDADRGDVIVLDMPNADGDEMALVARVVAVGGEEIAPGADGAVLVNGEVLDEPYLAPGVATSNLTAQRVPPDHVFVMGDNRPRSWDSRAVGAIPVDDVVAEVLE